MKRALIAAFGVLVAASVFGQQQQQTTTAATTTQAKPAEDSPLVKAAKNSHRATAKKSIVITNDDLKHSQGHISTTKKLPPVPGVSKSTEEVSDSEVAAVVKYNAEQRKAAEAAKAKPVQKNAAGAERVLKSYQEDDLFSDDDPARMEHRQEEAAKALQQQQQQNQQQQDAPKKP